MEVGEGGLNGKREGKTYNAFSEGEGVALRVAIAGSVFCSAFVEVGSSSVFVHLSQVQGGIHTTR